MNLPAVPPSVAAAAASRAARRADADVEVLLAESRFRLALSQDLLDDLGSRADVRLSAADPS